MAEIWYRWQKFTLLDYLVILMFVVLHFVISFGIQALAGVMGPAGVVTLPMLIITYLYLLSVILIRKVRTFLYYGILWAIPFTLSPAIVPPYPLKIAIVLWVHITGGVILLLLRKRFKLAMYVAGLWLAVNMYGTNILLFLALAPPAAAVAIKGLPIFIPIGIVLGLFAAQLVIWSSKPLEKSNLVKRIRTWG